MSKTNNEVNPCGHDYIIILNAADCNLIIEQGDLCISLYNRQSDESLDVLLNPFLSQTTIIPFYTPLDNHKQNLLYFTEDDGSIKRILSCYGEGRTITGLFYQTMK